jgi:hypothetical protein
MMAKKSKLILCLALVLSGTLFDCPSRGQALPLIEDSRGFSSGTSNKWVGHSFREIIPPDDVKNVILFDDRSQNLLSPKKSPQEIKNYYNRLFDYLEQSDQKAENAFLAGNEGTRAQFAVITSSGNVLRIQALSKMGPGGVSSVLFSGHGKETRIDIKDFQQSSTTNPPTADATSSLPQVETDYLLEQKPDDWTEKRFEQIVPAGKIKRIILLEEITDMFDYIPNMPKASTQEEHQNLYGKLFGSFEASAGKAEKLSLANEECPFARLLLFTDSNQIIYLEIIGTLGRIENNSVVGNHISGVLIHGHGKGVRINLNIAPISAAK